MEQKMLRTKNLTKRKRSRRLKQSMAFFMTIMLFLSCCPILKREAFAALIPLQEISKDEYYGRNALAKMDNGETLLYAYDKIAEGIENSIEKISLNDSNYTVTVSDLSIVFDAYINDYPQHFWRENGYTRYYSGQKVIAMAPMYSISGSELEEARTEFDSGIDEITDGITAAMSEFERELIIHDRLAEKVTYTTEPENAHNSYGAVVEGEAVCEGYARAFQYALDTVGIQAQTVTGTAGGGHAWNLVRIDGNYYYIDLTWNDQTPSAIYHTYFNLPESEMERTHIVESDIELPVCDSWDANYYTIFGGIIDTYTVEGISALLNKNLTAEIYFTGDSSDFWTWFGENVSEIASNCGITGGFSYGASTFGNSKIIRIINATRTTTSVAGVMMDNSSITLTEEGETAKVSATVVPSTANNQTITYSSSNTDVVIVNKYTGIVTATGEGTANIIATSEDGSKTATCKVTVQYPKEELTATLRVNGSISTINCTKGQQIRLDAEASGGTEEYSYKYVVHNLDNDIWYVLRDYNSTASYETTLSSAGVKEFIVSVKDSDGTIVSSNKVRVNVTSGTLAGSLTVSGSNKELTVGTGATIRLDASATGGTNHYTYKYVVHNLANDTWFTLKDYSEDTSYATALASAGEKEFVVSVKDSAGNIVATNKIKVTVKTGIMAATLKVNDTANTVTAKVNDTIQLAVTATEGTGTYTYKYVVHNLDTGAWFTLKDYNDSAQYTTKLASAGNKEFVVSVKDSSGTVVATNRVKVKITSS